MGGRGSASALSSNGRTAKMGDFDIGNASSYELDKQLIQRANSASLMDMGDSINNDYRRNIETIKALELSSKEKSDAISKQHQLATEALKLQSGSINPYVAGPARSVSGNVSYDRVVQKRAEMVSHMKKVQEKSRANAKAKEDRELMSAYKRAIANKQLSFTVNGKTYSRRSLRSKTFTN